MDFVVRSRPRERRWIGVTLVVLAALGASWPAWGSLPPGLVLEPRLVAPAQDAVANESGLRFAWHPPSGVGRHYLLVSRRPFETRGMSRLPTDPAITVHALSKPVASLADLGITLEADTRLYWAAVGEDPGNGRLAFSEVRSCSVLRKFGSRLEPEPALLTSPIGTLTPVVNAASERIRLAAGYEIDPPLGEPAMPEALREASDRSEGGRAYLVYFGAADPEQARESILASGGSVVSYVPDHTYLVRHAAASPLTVESEGAWVGVFQPGYKLSPMLDRVSIETHTVDLLLFPDGDLGSVMRSIEGLGGTVVGTSANGINTLVRASLPGTAVVGLAQHPDVMWIEPHVPFEYHNDIAQTITQTGTLTSRRIWDQGLMGEGQVVMTTDSGVNTTHDQFRDSTLAITDFGMYPAHRKIIAYLRGSNSPAIAFGDQQGVSYHGTHTAGTTLGTDDGIFGQRGYDGMAKRAKLFFMDLSGPSLGNQLDTFADLNDLYQPGYTGNAAGAARIASNSWGSPVSGIYDMSCMQVDQFMWNHPDFLICFSNGNQGGPGSVSSPASAKNVVSVGGVQNTLPPTGISTIYSSTSRGPTADGRRKPTLCAPASSLRSSTTPPNIYSSLSGTSMASPATAGTAALLRQYCTEGWYPTGTKVPQNGFAPSGALLKAMLVNSGNNMVSGFQAPDLNIGFGRINADSVLYFAGDQRRLLLVDMTAGLGHTQTIEYQVNVTDVTIPLEVTLCWSDYPGSPLASSQLVNNLNLVVTNGVVTYRGNNYTNGLSNTNSNVDNVNVEEATRIGVPTTGIWRIRVEAASVAFGPQPFGLCITGGIGTTAGTLALDRASYGSASTVQLRVADTNAGSSVDVRVTSNTEPVGELVHLTGTNGFLAGSLPLSPYVGPGGDGTLWVSNGDLITATYQDAAPAADITATARVSFDTAVISNVNANPQGVDRTLISWVTDKNASSHVYYGTTPALGSATTVDPTAALVHQVLVTGLVAGQTYYYDVESQDLNGSLTRDDNGGAHYRFTVRSPSDLLLVYSGPSFERPDYYASALTSLNWTYDVWQGPLSESPRLGDLSTGLRSYRAVWWQVGLEEYPPFTDAARESLTRYLDGGGRLAIVGHDVAWAFGEPSSPFFSTVRNDWLGASLHTFFVADPPTWSTVLGVAGDPISGAYASPSNPPFQEHRAGASGDEVGLVRGSGTAVPNWLSGDGTPDTCGFRWESNGPLGLPGTAVWAGMKTRLVPMYFEWSGINAGAPVSAARTDILDKALIWLLGRDRPHVTVTSPNGGSTETGNAIDIQWNETVAGGVAVASRTIDYSLDGGQSWTNITTTAGPSPYSWDLTGVANTLEALVRVRITDDGAPSLSAQDVNDATFRIQRTGGDARGPVVLAGSIRMNPNPVNFQQTTMLTAVVSDSTSGGGTVAAAEWSQGSVPAAAGSGSPMSGTFGTVEVPVSASIAPGTLAPGLQKVHVRGRDAAGSWGAASTLSVVVNDPAVPVLLALFQLEPVDGGIEVRWRFGDPGAFVATELERAPAAEGPWTRIEVEPREDDGTLVVVDALASGATAYYRLSVRAGNGQTVIFGPVAATAGRPIREFGLISVRPNPTNGPTRVEFAVPREAQVSLTIVDVQGREVARLADGIHRAGRYQAAWSGEGSRGPAPGGVYFLVFRAPERREVRRIVLAR